MDMEYRSIDKTCAIIDKMTALQNKMDELSYAIKYGNLNGHGLSLAMEDKRDYQRQFDRLKLELC